MKSLFCAGWIFLFSFTISWAITAQEENMLVKQTLSMFGQSSADLVEPSTPHIRTCGTATLMEAKRRFNELSPTSQALLRPVLQSRPSLPNFFDVPLLSGQTGPGFRVHYTTTGSDSVRNASIDLRGFGSPTPNGSTAGINSTNGIRIFHGNVRNRCCNVELSFYLGWRTHFLSSRKEK